MRIKQVTVRGKKLTLYCTPTTNSKRWTCKLEGQRQNIDKIIALLLSRSVSIKPNSGGQASIFVNSMEKLINKLFEAMLKIGESVTHVDITVLDTAFRFAWWPEERQLQYFCFENLSGVPDAMLSRLKKERKKYIKVEPINYTGVRVSVRVSLHQRISLSEAIEHLIACKE